MSSSLEVFDYIIKAVQQSNKGVFSREEVLTLLLKLREERIKSFGKELQEEIWETVGKQRGGDVV